MLQWYDGQLITKKITRETPLWAKKSDIFIVKHGIDGNFYIENVPTPNGFYKLAHNASESSFVDVWLSNKKYVIYEE